MVEIATARWAGLAMTTGAALRVENGGPATLKVVATKSGQIIVL